MTDMYSIYEAKARFSEVIRKVREGRTVMVSYRGEPVAEIRPFKAAGNDLARRLNLLEGLGVLVGGDERRGELRAVARKPGALQRFLEERDD
jgi:prevent-host-death family protein